MLPNISQLKQTQLSAIGFKNRQMELIVSALDWASAENARRGVFGESVEMAKLADAIAKQTGVRRPERK